ncbi:MAG TPA: hypothetical protein DDZ89_00385 [Clostridiales bacterium]|nr:hypothetical protein [Clostridiales bacterium]
MKTDEERHAGVFPVILKEYNPVWPKWYEEEKANSERLVGVKNITRISRFDSTSAPGPMVKPTVDIMLETNRDTNIS